MKVNKQKIIILEFDTGKVHIYDYDPFKYPEAEDFIESKSLNSNSCQWMTTSKLVINIK